MFNLKKFKLVKELTKIKNQALLLNFSGLKRSDKARDELISEIINDNKFVEEDLRLHAMVEDMLEKEFSPEIKNLKSYNFLVDSVVNKLKQKQLGDTTGEDIE
ncbi:MAG: hypothetical protein LUG16_03955 [Candidatus Gastranaerophilales bacterium]|nr:hypothetical protein [Candidatus Gastranaerophilales bacterium]